MVVSLGLYGEDGLASRLLSFLVVVVAVKLLLVMFYAFSGSPDGRGGG